VTSIRMFNQQELQILLGGVNSPIDLIDLRQHTSYGGLYDDQEDTIQTFWKVVDTFDQDQRRALLRFATSCSRPPLL
jgi:ubiquitin-protein ligase E3 C